MDKIDLVKEMKQFYNPPVKEVTLVEVPALNFLMIDGQGNPNTAPEYQQAVEALYALAYGIKFKIKKGQAGVDYRVMPLEGLWWADDMSQFSTSDKDSWKWTMMIAQPEFVDDGQVAEVLGETRRKKGLPGLERIRFERFHERLSAQVMHIGPFSEEGPAIARLHAFIAQCGYQRRGKHHEIYLKDLRKSAPEKLLTVLRQPVI